MELREGRYYITRNGELVGPVVNGIGPVLWTDDNNNVIREYEALDIIDTVDNAARKHVEGA